MTNAYKILVGKPAGMRPFGELKRASHFKPDWTLRIFPILPQILTTLQTRRSYCRSIIMRKCNLLTGHRQFSVLTEHLYATFKSLCRIWRNFVHVTFIKWILLSSLNFIRLIHFKARFTYGLIRVFTYIFWILQKILMKLRTRHV